MSANWRALTSKIPDWLPLTGITRVCVVLLLIWYVALGIRTQLAFPYPTTFMFDLNAYLDAYSRALKGADPYTYSFTNVYTAYLYPLPGLLIVGAFSWLTDANLRAASYVAVNLALLALMLRGIASRYGYRLDQVWWWIPLAFGFAPLLELLFVGQINLISSFGIFLMFVFSDSLAALAGLGLTIATVTKFTPAIFFVYIALQKKFRVVAWGAGLLVASFAVTYFLFGRQPPGEYLTVVSSLAQRFNVGENSTSLVSSLNLLGWTEQGSWPDVEHALLGWTAVVFVASGICALSTRQWEPFFLVVSMGTVVAPNFMWYHHYVFLLLPLFVWIAWSRIQPGIIAWCFLGLTLIQVDRWYWTRGLLPHIYVQVTLIGILTWQTVHAWRSHPAARALLGANAIAGVLLVGYLAHLAADADANLAQARQWIDGNLPAGAHVAVEANGPSIDRDKYCVFDYADLDAHPPDWYGKNGWDYIVTGFGTHGGVAASPTQRLDTAKRYEDFFRQFPLAESLAEGDTETRVYQTAERLPAHLTSARLGFYGGWLEFIGYDLRESNPQVGQALQLTLYWRALQVRRARLHLTARLVDAGGREVAKTEEDLFGVENAGQQWPEGVTSEPTSIGVDGTAAPGLYRVELDVDADGIGRLPVLSCDNQPVSDKIFVGPFKISPPSPSQADLSRARNLTVRFGDFVLLQGYSVKADLVHAGATVNVQLFWRSLAATDKNYVVFLHLLGPDGRVRAQVDTPTFNGTYPISMWDAGEMLRDDYAIKLPTDLAPGEYTIEVGVYQYSNLSRLPVTDGQGNTSDHLILDEMIRVEPPLPQAGSLDPQ